MKKESDEGAPPPLGAAFAQPREVQPVVHYAIFLLVLGSVALSTLALVKVAQTEKRIASLTATPGEVASKLTLHPEAKPFFGVVPQVAVRIDQNNIGSLQRQVPKISLFFEGNHLLQYSNVIFIYNYSADKIVERLETHVQPAPVLQLGPQ